VAVSLFSHTDRCSSHSRVCYLVVCFTVDLTYRSGSDRDIAQLSSPFYL